MPGICESAKRHGALIWSFVSASRLRGTILYFESSSRISAISGLFEKRRL